MKYSHGSFRQNIEDVAEHNMLKYQNVKQQNVHISNGQGSKEN